MFPIFGRFTWYLVLDLAGFPPEISAGELDREVRRASSNSSDSELGTVVSYYEVYAWGFGPRYFTEETNAIASMLSDHCLSALEMLHSTIQCPHSALC